MRPPDFPTIEGNRAEVRRRPAGINKQMHWGRRRFLPATKLTDLQSQNITPPRQRFSKLCIYGPIAP